MQTTLLRLYIGSKNYASWLMRPRSMRPRALTAQASLAFDEAAMRVGGFAPPSALKKTITAANPLGKAAALVGDGLAVRGTRVVAQCLAQQFPDQNLWPPAVQARAWARRVCAGLHSGFGALRSACGMSLAADLHTWGQLIWRDNAAARADVQRSGARLCGDLLAEHGGPMLFGDFSAVDAYFAPVGRRLRTFARLAPAVVAGYGQRVAGLPSVTAWTAAALAKADFLALKALHRLQR